MTTMTNTYLPSQLVSLDILHLLGQMDSPILRCTGPAQTSTFDESKYIAGKTIGYQVAGIPPVHRGSVLTFSPYEQRTLYIKADDKRWYFSVTHAFNQTDDIFYTNKIYNVNYHFCNPFYYLIFSLVWQAHCFLPAVF